jgi:chorismate mutase
VIAVAEPTERHADADAGADPLGDLAACRAEIEAIDLKLVALLAERMALGQRTAGLKRAAGLPILDPRREAEVIRRAVVAAREKGLPTEALRQIFWHIVGLSRRAQEENA